MHEKFVECFIYDIGANLTALLLQPVSGTHTQLAKLLAFWFAQQRGVCVIRIYSHQGQTQLWTLFQRFMLNVMWLPALDIAGGEGEWQLRGTGTCPLTCCKFENSRATSYYGLQRVACWLKANDFCSCFVCWLLYLCAGLYNKLTAVSSAVSRVR